MYHEPLQVNIPDSIKFFPISLEIACWNEAVSEYDNAYYLGNAGKPYFALVKVKSQAITSCQIPKGTKRIYGAAFSGRNNLESITIPGSVTKIAQNPFNGCANLKRLTFVDASGRYSIPTKMDTNWYQKTGGTLTDLSDPSANAAKFTVFDAEERYMYWYRK